MPSITPQPVPDGPVRRLFHALMQQHRAAGEPSTRTLARAVAHSHATIHAALRGPKVPRWGLLELIVEQLGGDVEHFKQLWIAARDWEEPRGNRSMAIDATVVGTNDPSVLAGPSIDLAGSPHPDALAPVSRARIAETLERLDIQYLTDGDGSLLAMWERHNMIFALEGPTDEILVMRVRANATVPPDWADRALRAVNEWNHTRRFHKAYVGDPTDRGQLPVYGEIQFPLLAGVADSQLVELVDNACAVATGFVDWLHDEGGLL